MFKKLTVGFSAIILIVSAGMAINAHARFSQVFSLNNETKVSNDQRFKTIDCESGAKFVQNAGFDHVFATDCSGSQYSYNGFRKSVEYTIVFNAQSAGMTTVSR